MPSTLPLRELSRTCGKLQPVVGLRVPFLHVQADCNYLPLFRCDERELIEESPLLRGRGGISLSGGHRELNPFFSTAPAKTATAPKPHCFSRLGGRAFAHFPFPGGKGLQTTRPRRFAYRSPVQEMQYRVSRVRVLHGLGSAASGQQRGRRATFLLQRFSPISFSFNDLVRGKRAASSSCDCHDSEAAPCAALTAPPLSS
jgi:hypothetical protein